MPDFWTEFGTYLIKYGVFRMKPETPDPAFDPTRFRLTPGVKKEAIERMNCGIILSHGEE